MKLKDFLYNATIILPVVGKILKGCKTIVDLVVTNKQLIEAYKQIHDDVNYLKEFNKRIDEFNQTMMSDDED